MNLHRSARWASIHMPRFDKRARRNALMPPAEATAMRIPTPLSTLGGDAE
jgi:hypothetical protein